MSRFVRRNLESPCINGMSLPYFIEYRGCDNPHECGASLGSAPVGILTQESVVRDVPKHILNELALDLHSCILPGVGLAPNSFADYECSRLHDRYRS